MILQKSRIDQLQKSRIDQLIVASNEAEIRNQYMFFEVWRIANQYINTSMILLYSQ